MVSGWNNSQFYVGRANTDLESGRATATQAVARGVMGLNGDFTIGERDFNWEVAANYGSSRNSQANPAYVFQNVQNALNSTLNSAGQIVCAGNPVELRLSTVSSKCAPLNIFGLGSPEPGGTRSTSHILRTAESFNTQRDLTAFIGGDVFKLPAGEVKGVIGYENRRETAKFTPDDFLYRRFGQPTASAVEGEYHTNEVYAETLIPLFAPAQDIPLLHRLELDGAIRRVDNSIAGTADTWTAGLIWSPVQDVHIARQQDRSIRAPAVTELFLPSSTSSSSQTIRATRTSSARARRRRRARRIASRRVSTPTPSSRTSSTPLPRVRRRGTPSYRARPPTPKLRRGAAAAVGSAASVTVDYVEINLTNAIES